MSAPAGWYVDPAAVTTPAGPALRWWDGERWTRWLSDDADAEPPGSEPSGSPASEDPGSESPRQSNAPAQDPDSGRTVGIPVAVALVIGVVVVALVAVGLTVTLTEDRIRSGPAVAPPSAPALPGLVLDPSTRSGRIENVSLVLPGPPYVCGPTPGALPPSFSSALSCDAPIHRDYRGTADWSASSGLGLVADSLVVQDDLDRTGRNLYESLRRQFFAGEQTTVQKLQPVRNTDQGLFFTGEVHYSIKGLPSRYDRLVLGVIELRSGRYAAFFSSRPNDAPATVVDVLNRSIATLSAR